MKNKIINLHNHSHFSILDGLSTPEQIVEKAVEFEVPGIAITDHGNMNNYGHFYLAAKKAGIKPILGIECYFIPSLKKWNIKKEELENEEISGQQKKEKLRNISKRYHLILLVKNLTGFYNLNKLIYESYKNFYYRPRIDRKLLIKYSEGLICSSACIAGEIQQAILRKERIGYIEKLVYWYYEVFKDDFYFEVQINEMQEQVYVNEIIFQLSDKFNIPIILTGDSHYSSLEDQKAHQTLLLMNSKSTYQDLKNKQLGEDMNSGAWEFDTKRLYIKSYDDYNKDRKELDPKITKKMFDKICENTFEIYDKIENYEIDQSVKLKDINPEIKDKSYQLYEDCFNYLNKLGLNKNKIYVDRLKYELSVIKEKGLENYFYVVKSIIDHAINNMNMIIGPGRGSAAGSLVVYLLGITQIDPIKFGLYFERFLARKDYPDIDIDFEENDKIKEWILSTYKNDTACISSYSTYHIFGLIKDLGRVYNIEDASYWNTITNMIRNEIRTSDKDLNINELTYDETFNNSEIFREIMQKYKNVCFDMKTLMGKYRHIGKHAAGIIISNDLIKNQPIMIIKDNNQTSLTEGMQDQTLSKFGFIKLDILGLKTLKVIHECIKIISKNNNEIKNDLLNKIHPNNIELDIPEIFKKIFKNKNLCGIFQFDTESSIQVIDKIKPKTFNDLVVINAINRPGPKQFVDLYVKNSNNKNDIEYIHPVLKPILQDTAGIIIFQEQIMEVAKKLAGYTLEEANVLRKAMGKKIHELMNEQEGKFISGCLENKVKKSVAKELFDQIKEFASYSFNKAHALSYAMISYQCAYLKTFYEKEFYTALLIVEEKEVNVDKIVKEIKRNNINIKPLNIKKSESNFSLKNDIIYFGFINIKGIGEKAVENIIYSRSKSENNISSLQDFLLNKNINKRVCNKRVVENLIKSFVFGKNIEDMLEFYNFYRDSKLLKKEKEIDMFKRLKKDFFYLKNSNELEIEYLSDIDKSLMEKNLYGTNLIFSVFNINGRKEKIEKVFNNGKAGGFKDKRNYSIVQFKNIFIRKDKNGKNMAFLDLEDIYGEIKSGIIFASNFLKKDTIENDVYCISGNLKDKFIIEVYKNIDNLFNNC